MIFKLAKFIPVFMFAALLALSFDMAATGWGALRIGVDQAMADAKFWRGRKKVVVSPVKNLAPAQMPGPLDTWGGAEQKEIEFKTPFLRSFKVTISFVDSHDSNPPTLDILVNGSLFTTVQVAKGAGRPSNEWFRHGVRSKISFIVPEEYLHDTKATIIVRSSKGSWAAIENITVAVIVPTWKFLMAGFGWLSAFILFIIICAGAESWKNKLEVLADPFFTISHYIKRVALYVYKRSIPLETVSFPKSVVWTGLFVFALAMPTNEHAVFSGLPLNGRVEAIAISILFPLLLVLNHRFFSASITCAMILFIIALKTALLFVTPQAGVCLQPYWQANKDAPSSFVKTYEGFWAKGCFPVNSRLDGTRYFPMEHYNRYYESPDPTIRFSFHFLPPKDATALVIDTGGYRVNNVKLSGSAKQSNASGFPGAHTIDIKGHALSDSYVSGEIVYRWSGPQWTFIPYFVDSDGNLIKDVPYSNRFFSEKPDYGNILRLTSVGLAILVDVSMALCFLLGLIGALVNLYRLNDRVILSLVTLIILWVAHDIVLPFYGYHSFSALPLLSGALSFIPDRIAGSFDIFTYILAAILIPVTSRMRGQSAFILAFTTVFIFYGPMVVDNVGAFSILGEGNDWRTYQRFARVIFSENAWLSGIECPPTWNLPFAYFTALLHIISGQSMFFQRMIDLYALAFAITGLYIIGSQWGLPKRLAWISGFAFLYLHLVLGYYTYIGGGLTEHPAMLAIFAMALLFAHYRTKPSIWILLCVMLIAFVSIGWRPNFAPWIFLSSLALLGVDENRYYKPFIQGLWAIRWKLTALATTILIAIVLFMLRNYFECDQFIYISSKVKGMYALTSLKSRLDSVVAMVTMVPTSKAGITDSTVLYFCAIPLIAGWVAAMAGGVSRAGILAKIPIALSAFAWAGFLIYFFKFNINAGYGVRWGVPLFPIWVLSFFFFLNGLKEIIAGWSNDKKLQAG